MTILSAIIPTRDRPDYLRDCLATLCMQEPSSDRLEIVVVDDGGTLDLSLILEAFGGEDILFRLERQEAAGLNAARNLGAEVARGDILAYLDDDTLVSPRWSVEVILAFEAWGCDALAGRIQLKLEGPEPDWLSSRLRASLSEFDLGTEPRWLDEGAVPYGANCAVSRRFFGLAGGFRRGLDRVGTSLISNGDIEFFRQIRTRGARIVYWPEAHVLHRVAQSRLTLDWFRRRLFAQGISDVLLDPPNAEKLGLRMRSREVIRTMRAGPILLKSFAQGKGGVHASLWLSYCRGRMAALNRREKVG